MKIKITYTEAEKALFERTRGELLQTVPDARQHESTAPRRRDGVVYDHLQEAAFCGKIKLSQSTANR